MLRKKKVKKKNPSCAMVNNYFQSSWDYNSGICSTDMDIGHIQYNTDKHDNLKQI